MTQLEQLTGYRCPAYAAYPSIPLYRDQVLGFLNEVLAPLWGPGETPVTASMINNYVKGRVLPPPVQKKYSRDQVVCLYLINLLKQVLSMEEIRALLTLEFPQGQVEAGYARFCRRLEGELQGLSSAPPAREGHPLLEAAVRSLVYRRYAAALLEAAASNIT